MASGVNVKMGVSGVAQFKQGMKESQAAVKNLDQQLKLNEQQMKLNGDAETYLQNKSQLLNEQIRKQQEVVRQAEAALNSMRKNGVSQTSVEFQKMQQASYASQTELMRMRTELQNLGESAEDAQTGVGNMNDELASIGHGISWQNVTSGIEKITDKLEAAAKKAYRLGKAIVSATMEGGQWADDLATRAEVYEMSPEQLYRMEQTALQIDTDVDTIIGARKKLITAMGQNDNQETMGAFAALGINYLKGDDDNIERVFWKAGEGLVQMEDKVARNEYAMKLFGRSWEELIPIFKTGREEYEKTMKSVTWVGDETFENLTGMDDARVKMNSEWEALKRQFEGTMANVMTPIMETLTGLMREFNTYLQSDEGQQMLANLAETISGLFDDLANIKPEEVINGISNAVGELQKGLEWLKDHGGEVKKAIEGIAWAFVGIKIAGLAGNVMQFVNGLNGLLNNGTGTSTGGNGMPDVVPTGTGKAAGGGFLSGLINKLTLFAGANAISDVTHGQIRATFKELMKQTEGMRAQERSDFALQHDLGLTEGQVKMMREQSPSNGPADGSSNGRFFGDIPEFTDSTDRMTEVAGQMTAEIGETRHVNADMSAAVKFMESLPADLRAGVESAIISGMSQVTIIVDDRGINALSDRVGGGMGQKMLQMVK